MNEKKTFVILVLFLSLLLAGRAFADFSLQVDYTSRYLWRGFDLNPIKRPAIQPSISYSLEGGVLSFDIWGSFSLENKEVNELDFTVKFTYDSLDNIRFIFGAIHYGWYFEENFSFRANTSQEIFMTAGLKNMFLHPAITVFYDFANGDGIYASLDLTQSVKIMDTLQAEINTSLGYNEGQWLAEDMHGGFSDWNIGLVLSYSIGKFKIAPFIKYTRVLLESIGKENHFWFGLSGSFNN